MAILKFSQFHKKLLKIKNYNQINKCSKEQINPTNNAKYNGKEENVVIPLIKSLI